MRVGVIGAGGHSIAAHLPSLAHLTAERDLHLVAIADPNIAAARAAAKQFGFSTSYVDPIRLLDGESLDACLIITPSSTIPDLLVLALDRDIASLVEKPFAATVHHAERLVEGLGEPRSLVMVSSNRRFDPAFTAALAWLGEAPTSWTAHMARHNRTEADFIFHTGIHLVDASATAIGPLSVDAKVTRRQSEVQALLTSAGIVGSIAFAPASGANEEVLVLRASDRSVHIRFGSMGSSGWEGWADGTKEVDESTAGLEPWIRDGTLAETVAFLNAIENDLTSPVPLTSFLESMRVAETLNGPINDGIHS